MNKKISILLILLCFTISFKQLEAKSLRETLPQVFKQLDATPHREVLPQDWFFKNVIFIKAVETLKINILLQKCRAELFKIFSPETLNAFFPKKPVEKNAQTLCQDLLSLPE